MSVGSLLWDFPTIFTWTWRNNWKTTHAQHRGPSKLNKANHKNHKFTHFNFFFLVCKRNELIHFKVDIMQKMKYSHRNKKK